MIFEENIKEAHIYPHQISVPLVKLYICSEESDIKVDIYLGESDINSSDIFRSHDRRQSFPVLPSQITTNDGYIGGSINKYFMSTPVAHDFIILVGIIILHVRWIL